MVARHAHQMLGLAVIGLEIVVPDRPVDALAVRRLQLEVVGEESGHIAQEMPGGTADAPQIAAAEGTLGHVIIVRIGGGSVRRRRSARRVVMLVRTPLCGKAPAQTEPVNALFSRLQREHAMTRAGELPRADSTADAGADDDHVEAGFGIHWASGP